jgi:hypothetical protein
MGRIRNIFAPDFSAFFAVEPHMFWEQEREKKKGEPQIHTDAHR